MAGGSIVQVYFIVTLCITGGSAQYENCTNGIVGLIGSGYCTVENNNDRCLYDGGDCCQCTSIDDGSPTSDISPSYFLCVDPSSPCYSPTAVHLQSNCINGTIGMIRNDWCDEENNNEECLYDGGDCCECTNMDAGYSSSDTSSSSLLCVDPSSPCYSPTAVALQSNCINGDIADIGNGWCNEENNNEGCLYDGGDCCECTSIDDGYSSSDISSSSLLCADPSSPCYSPTAVALQSNCTDGDITNVGNGRCDEENNNEGCLYDGGDCCECTSMDDGYSSSLLCVNPSSPCYSPTAVALKSNCINGDIADIGNGWCNEESNNEACLYDGGDCCECTSIDGGYSSSDTSSSSLLCADPSSPCYSPTAVALQSNCINGTNNSIQDGWCDDENNNKGCLYDGGDCCQCTSIDDGSPTSDTSLSYFLCVDPSSLCYSPTAVHLQSNCINGTIGLIRNGWCNGENNNDGCLYDGGDCCDCTSMDDGYSSFDTSSSSLLCVDPSSPCYSPTAVALQSNCIDGDITNLGDGRCDEENNNEGCLYDGGDCCICTCIDGQYYDCDSFGFKCLDTEVADLEPYICEKSQHTLTTCAGVQREWTVENASHVRALAEAVRCSGGIFNVKWKGNVSVEKTISIFDGTILNVSSINSDSAIDGDGKTRLFSVVNASLHLSNITVSNGNAAYGGAIAASRSRASFTMVSFIGNTATNDGGALHLSSGTSASFVGYTTFLNNTASNGGALCLVDGSNASWTRNTSFSYNVATSNGGALYLLDSSRAVWTAEAHFFHNSAESYGGALYLLHSSSAVWTVKAHFLHNNAGWRGGALYLLDSSSAVWTAEAHFLHGSAESYGGALYLRDSSSAVWTAESHFLNNIAGNEGGALYLLNSSSAVWTAEARFVNNSARYRGGTLCLRDSSSAAWIAEVHFLNNSAESDGGALYVTDGSNASWGGNIHSSENASTGGRGGALYVSGISSANLTTVCIFSGNNALSNGGAVYADDGASLSWSVKTLFVDNTAEKGGALVVSHGVNVEWSDETNFTSNHARLDGGAVCQFSDNDEGSIIVINGPTSFVNNTCGGNGGAMSLMQSLAVILDSKHILFLRNSAGASGGAVYTAFNGIGIVFMEVTFVENVAQIGGGVYSTGSGTEVTVDRDNAQMNNPMTFDRCKFIGNYAFATGGAVDSASGRDVFVRTSFEGNKARLGGALRLAGIAFIDECSFEENVSELGGGPAVSNIGYMSNVKRSFFDHNVFKCEGQTFLHFNEFDDPFETICNGCPTKYFGCSFGKGQGSPTCTSLSEAGMEHTTSKGGYTTVEELLIHKGYWRATNTSTNILRCFNTKACKGGLTGASDYCVKGYEGPYCSVCSKNYVSSLRFTCRECSDRTAVVITAAVLLALALVVVIAIVSYLVSADVVGARRGIVDHVMERVPLQSIKLIIIVWQILTQFTSVTNVNFPSVYQTFLDGINVFNFDLSWVLSAGCLLEVDFHDRLLWTTIAPLVIMGLLGVTYAITVHRNLTTPGTSLRHIQYKYISMALLVTILVYSSVSSVAFQMFACDNLDDGKRYLRADYNIECDSPKHRVLQIYSGLMILLYPVGIPVLYSGKLFSNRHILRDEANRKESPEVRSISNIWKPYKPQRFYYEVIECARRIMLTGVIVFIYPNSAAQVAATFAIAVVFIFVSEGMAPYESPWDACISRMGHAIIFATMYLALLLKVDVSGENDASQEMFEVILVACHGCMVLAVIVQIVIMAISMRRGRHQEDPRPRLRPQSNSNRKIHVCLVEDDISKDEL